MTGSENCCFSFSAEFHRALGLICKKKILVGGVELGFQVYQAHVCLSFGAGSFIIELHFACALWQAK